MSKKILLVEDDDDIAALLRLNLQDEGYQIVHEADGAQALRQLDNGVWDAVILDLMLPNVDGLEICRRIRQQTRYLPVIIISARSSETQRVEGPGNGGRRLSGETFFSAGADCPGEGGFPPSGSDGTKSLDGCRTYRLPRPEYRPAVPGGQAAR